MPPKLRPLKQRSKLSWHSTPRRQCTIDQKESKEYFRLQLESFRQYIRDHYIGEFGSSHKVLAKGKHSRQFYSTSLRSLLSLDTIPDQIKIPCWHLPHNCDYCHKHPYPRNLWTSLIVHISAWPKRRGRPSRNQNVTGPALIPPSSSESSVDSDDFSVDPEAYDGLYSD